jgi:hypothetical protein
VVPLEHPTTFIVDFNSSAYGGLPPAAVVESVIRIIRGNLISISLYRGQSIFIHNFHKNSCLALEPPQR